MLEVLYFSQKDVKVQLLERALHPHPLRVVTAVRHGDHMRPVEEREPFRTLERRFGDVLGWLVVADDGKPEGMWRDPMGDLADRFFPEDSQAAFAAANGYLVLVEGQVEAVVKKHADPGADVWFLQEALAAAHRGIPRPDPANRPGARRTASGAAGPASNPAAQGRRRTSSGSEDPAGNRRGKASSGAADPAVGAARDHRRGPGRPVDPDAHSGTSAEGPGPTTHSSGPPDGWAQNDPWTLLGLSEGATLTEGRKAFRALIAQYHPDKVQHLAPEFRELAERRTRQIIAAWETLEQALK